MVVEIVEWLMLFIIYNRVKSGVVIDLNKRRDLYNNY